MPAFAAQANWWQQGVETGRDLVASPKLLVDERCGQAVCARSHRPCVRIPSCLHFSRPLGQLNGPSWVAPIGLAEARDLWLSG